MNKILLSVIFTLSLGACDPPRDLYQTGTIEINAAVINPRTNISLGDSVIFSFEVPDTIELNGIRIKAYADNNDGANNGFNANKIIPSLPGGFSNNPSLNTCSVWANPGSLTPQFSFVFANQNGKLLGKYYMIPGERGVYFFEQSQEGFADLNNNRYKLRFRFNFGNINRNHQLLIDSAGPTNNFALYLQDKINRGLEIYGFKVN